MLSTWGFFINSFLFNWPRIFMSFQNTKRLDDQLQTELTRNWNELISRSSAFRIVTQSLSVWRLAGDLDSFLIDDERFVDQLFWKDLLEGLSVYVVLSAWREIYAISLHYFLQFVKIFNNMKLTMDIIRFEL